MRHKDDVIILRVSKDEKEAIQAAARKAGLSMATFILMLWRNWSDGIRFEPKKEA